MFLLTKGFGFLDINYLVPETSYKKLTKAYKCEDAKLWFPYKWFNSSEKLDCPSLPYSC